MLNKLPNPSNSSPSHDQESPYQYKNHANIENPALFHKIETNMSSEKSGTVPVFSTVPYLTAKGSLEIYENAVFFHHPLQPIHYAVTPDRTENDIKNFSSKSRKRLFELFSCLNYSSYGIPCFVSATWHYDAPDTKKQIKTHLANFVKRLKRSLPEFHSIWKFEYQKRGTPHFHFILLPLDNKINMYTPEREIEIKKHWLDLKSCKCKHCASYSIKTVQVENYKMAISYISKEIAKVLDNYEDHDLGRIWGSSQNMRCAPLHNLPCDIQSYRQIIDRKLEQFNKINDTWLYINGLRFVEQNSSLFIPYSDILDIVSKLKKSENDFDSFYRKYKLKHSLTSKVAQ